MTDPLVRPLEGVRVLELAHLIAGPTGGMYLADMGADVIKVESREAPDASRSVYGVARAGEGILHLTVNRNKRALCLDLQKPAGRETFYRVVKTADVVLEGYRNGVAEKLGIDYATLAPMNPRLIYCSVSAFGPEGPWRAKPGLDALAQAVGWLMAVTGEADGGPVLVGAPVVDTIGGLLAAQGILMALIGRGRTGQGQRVDVSLLDGVLLSHLARLSVFHETGEPLPRYGSGHPNLVPYRAGPRRALRHPGGPRDEPKGAGRAPRGHHGPAHRRGVDGCAGAARRALRARQRLPAARSAPRGARHPHDRGAGTSPGRPLHHHGHPGEAREDAGHDPHGRARSRRALARHPARSGIDRGGDRRPRRGTNHLNTFSTRRPS